MLTLRKTNLLLKHSASNDLPIQKLLKIGQLQAKFPTGSIAGKSPENISLSSSIYHLQKPYANYYEAQKDCPKTRLT